MLCPEEPILGHKIKHCKISILQNLVILLVLLYTHDHRKNIFTSNSYGSLGSIGMLHIQGDVVPVTPCKWYLTFLYQRSNIFTHSVYPTIFEKQCLDLYYLNELCSHPVLSTFTNKQYSQILIITVPTSKKLKH